MPEAEHPEARALVLGTPGHEAGTPVIGYECAKGGSCWPRLGRCDLGDPWLLVTLEVDDCGTPRWATRWPKSDKVDKVDMS